MDLLGKTTIPARTGSRPPRAGPRTHQCVRGLKLVNNLIEELEELFCQDAVSPGECKNQGREKSRPSQIIVPASIHIGQVWGWARLGQFIEPTGRCENQNKVQNRLSRATKPANSY